MEVIPVTLMAKALEQFIGSDNVRHSDEPLRFEGSFIGQCLPCDSDGGTCSWQIVLLGTLGDAPHHIKCSRLKWEDRREIVERDITLLNEPVFLPTEIVVVLDVCSSAFEQITAAESHNLAEVAFVLIS